jgi:hypothetical protein
MQEIFTLWECPPLRARMTRRQCGLNQMRARSPSPRGFADGGVPPGRVECIACRGIEWWSEQTGRAPLEVAASDLLVELRRKEALRRRLRGAEGEVAAPPPARRARSRRAPAAGAL